MSGTQPVAQNPRELGDQIALAIQDKQPITHLLMDASLTKAFLDTPCEQGMRAIARCFMAFAGAAAAPDSAQAAAYLINRVGVDFYSPIGDANGKKPIAYAVAADSVEGVNVFLSAYHGVLGNIYKQYGPTQRYNDAYSDLRDTFAQSLMTLHTKPEITQILLQAADACQMFRPGFYETLVVPNFQDTSSGKRSVAKQFVFNASMTPGAPSIEQAQASIAYVVGCLQKSGVQHGQIINFLNFRDMMRDGETVLDQVRAMRRRETSVTRQIAWGNLDRYLVSLGAVAVKPEPEAAPADNGPKGPNAYEDVKGAAAVVAATKAVASAPEKRGFWARFIPGANA